MEAGVDRREESGIPTAFGREDVSKIVPLRFPVFEPSIPIRHVYSRPASVNLEFIAHLPYDKAHHPVNTTRKRVARR